MLLIRPLAVVLQMSLVVKELEYFQVDLTQHQVFIVQLQVVEII
jgi:hypothetical protein